MPFIIFSMVFPGFSLVFLGSSVVVYVFGVPRCSKKNANPFAVLSSAYFGDAVTDHVSRGSVLFFGFPDPIWLPVVWPLGVGGCRR